jgi:hypothetical protein
MLNRHSLTHVLELYCGVLHELRRRGLTRTENNPTGDLAEAVVSRSLNLTLVEKSKASFDAIHKNGQRYQIKGRRITPSNPSRQLGTIRGLDKKHFDFLAGVIFDKDFRIYRAALIPYRTVKAFAKHQSHVNGARFELKDFLWERREVIDITNKLKTTFAKL